MLKITIKPNKLKSLKKARAALASSLERLGREAVDVYLLVSELDLVPGGRKVTLYMFDCMCMYVYIYIYIRRERERGIDHILDRTH